MNQQAANLATATLRGPRRQAPLALVTGGKGGVGKSTLVANVGLALAGRGLRVLAVDLDFGLANLQVLLRRDPARNQEDWFCGRAQLRECLCTVEPGLDLLPASSGELEMARPDSSRRRRLLEGLAELSVDYDLILADSAAGIGPDVLGFAIEADHVLVVTTPDPAALTDAYGLIKAFDAAAREARLELPTPEVLVNMAGDPQEAQRVSDRLTAVCQRFLARRPRVLGHLPRGREVVAGSARQEPFVRSAPSSAVARALETITLRYERLARAVVRP
ncbi:AAA family ATPase [Engelhardtia mirabilis]|uniref:Flagellum site-determining protein YlxH n=1 Tax=Engelhardtia mirabilis TaxID=2528011 RepID=A0A518BSQ4_9BACT|nr:Flagellum site-determining protein YlxH [Planctomycetes bacterium Pla133]QDV04327.1 Flagellum site-determining protein YlxH [Planctomycetes bacterium Pla86]